ncbi:ribosomal RNA-processing protein 14-C-like isoform X1 [Alnus glutinosa]|uniref:ribosomal RNA-processing protein 14-C-like isoform X1 n=1 Tax=Alnus glutinosa TaxID=3517 RepID=UPI002D782BD0|nr:ribosomal RNA-processing protein 14-C-like isoform X1 [Alnus glutinosa]
MKKKKQNPVTDSKPDADLKSIIHQHSLFFDKLVELIPAKFYLPNDDKDRPWFQGLSKAKKASAKKESRENIKKARRDRLDPEKSSTTTLDLLKQSLEKEKLNESGDEEIEIKPMLSGLEGNDRQVTLEELRLRLHQKIEQSRAIRNPEVSNRAKKRSGIDSKKGIQQKKRKREFVSEEKKPATSSSADKVEKDIVEASKGLAFGHVKLGNEEEHGKKKKAKLSKFKELERAKKLEEAKKDPGKGEIISKKHSWKAATNRAAGMKVHDDPSLLKRSIQKEKKRHQKNAEKWKERLQTTVKMKAEKQQKRSENISHRIQDKKMRRIAKREKKLMRPGFEGRKEGFINEGKIKKEKRL